MSQDARLVGLRGFRGLLGSCRTFFHFSGYLGPISITKKDCLMVFQQEPSSRGTREASGTSVRRLRALGSGLMNMRCVAAFRKGGRLRAPSEVSMLALGDGKYGLP